ncbi:MAG: beta strand repeat-containing protein [Aurantibacter sp.]
MDITSLPGNGGFQFSIDGGPWLTPTPATATTYTFANLANGTYTIDVQDGFGCAGVQQSVTIDPQLTAIVDVVDITTCADGSITVNASGGDGAYEYAFVPTTTSPAGLFTPANTYAVTAGNDGTYDVYVRDNSATVPFCEYVETVTVDPATPISFTSTPTDPLCYNGVGSIEVNVTSGITPYTIQIIDLDNGGASDQTVTNILIPITNFYNLAPGNYTINVTDVSGCTVTDTPVNIANPDELTGSVVPILPAACGSVNPLDYGFQFVGYPGTLGTIEFSADGGTTWTGDNSVPGTTDVLMGYISGTNVFPSMRTVDGFGNTICQTDLPRYTIPYPLDDLDISIATVVVGCNELQVTVQGTAGIPNYEYAFTDDPATFNPATAAWTAPIPGSHTWVGLIPGRTYVFYVRDSTGCIRQSNVNVNDITTNPLEITATYEPSCSGANDAEITYTITDTDATTHPSMHWEFYDAPSGALVQSSGGNIAWNTTITVSGLAPGEYYITVTEVDGGGVDACVSGSENLLVEELNPITATLNKLSDISCSAPGLISIENINGGGGTFTYTVTGPAPFVTISGTPDNPIAIPANSPAGNYNVTITDQFGCFTNLGPIALTLTPNPTIDSMVVDNCSSPTSLTINATSGAPQILYSIDGGANYVDNGGVFNNLAPATYNISIIDSNGCIDTDTVDIYPVLEANVSLTKLLDCTVTPDAEITIDITFGSGNYDYEIVNGLGPVVPRSALPSDPYVFSTTIPEHYTITIYDNNTSAPECNRVFSIIVPPAVVPALSIDFFTDVSCSGADDGTITVSATDNGIAPFTFEIISGPGSGAAFPIAPTSTTNTTATFTGLEGLVAPGITYTVRATGSNGCTTDITQAIAQPDAIANVNATVVEFACTTANNQNDATITIDDTSITGGSGTYVVYEFINDQGTPGTGDDVIVQTGPSTVYTETNTAGGTYIINVYDDNGCIGTTNATIVEFIEISNPTVTITQDITCVPGNDAEVTLGVTLNPVTGTPNLTYSVVGTDNAYSSLNQASNVFAALGIGNYLATVTNTDTGCFVETTFEIEDPNNFEITTTTVDVVCFGDNGSVSFTINDPVNPYGAGFTWQIYDSQGTATLADDVIIPAANGVSANVGPTVPFAIPAGEYRVEVTQDSDPSCVNNALFTIAGPSAAITANVDVTPITCVGNDGIIEIIDVLGGWGNYAYYVGTVAPTVVGDYVANPRFENLAPGTYEAWVIDQNGCQQQVQNTIVLADPAPIAATLQINQPNCTNFSGEIEVVGVTGGQGSNYSYQLIKDGNPVGAPQNTTVFSGLDAGSYQVQITDQWACTFTTAAELLYEPIIPLATVVKTIDCSAIPGGEITVTQTGGSGNFNYDIVNPDLTAGPSNTTGVFTGLTQVGTYTFTITDQAVGHACVVSITQELFPAVIPVITVDSFTDVTCNGADDGTIDVSVIDNGVGPYTFEIISGPGSTAIFPLAPSSNTATTATFTGLEGLAAGITYTIRATGSNSCFVDIVQVITQPDVIANVNATVVEFACTVGNNQDNATITIDDAAITGGSGNYVTYEFINDQGTPGTGDDVVVQTGPSTVYTETNTGGGSYIINVYDDNGCIGTTTAAIAEFVEITNPTVTITQDITCNPGNDAEVTLGITLNPVTGTPNLTYSVAGTDNAYSSLNQASNVFAALGIGNYLATVTNTDTGCFVQTTFEIEDPNTFEIATTVMDVVCFGTDGSVSFTISDSINPYAAGFTWQIYDSQGTPALGDDVLIVGANGVSANLGPTVPFAIAAGEYRVEVTQDSDPSCVNNDLFTIAGPSAAITANTDVTPITCLGNDGIIEIIDVLGGWGNYAYYVGTVAPTVVGDYVANPRFENLAPGTYEAWVIDQNGCQQQVQNTIVLADPAPIAATLQVNQPNCNNFSGEIEVIGVTGGQGSNYTYQLIKDGNPVGAPQNTTVFSGLDAGSYQVQITDQLACTFTTLAELLYEPIIPLATVVKTIDCSAIPGGEITITQTGGSGNFNYDIINPDLTAGPSNTTGVFTGLTQVGDYVFTITDQAVGHACVVSITQELLPAVLPVISIDSFTDVTCNGDNDGTISVSVIDNGVGPYTFEIISGPGSTAVFPLAPTSFTSTTATFTGLEGLITPGITYTIRATGSNSCTTDITQPITQPDVMANVNATVVEFGCTIGNNTDNATISIDVPAITGGSGNYVRFEFINTTIATTVQDGANPVYVETDYAGGNYTINVYDDMGCSASTAAVILPFVEISNPTVTTNVDVTCNPGGDSEIQVNVTVTPVTATPNLEYNVTGTDVVYNTTNTTGLFTALGVGNYAVTVTNLDTGCFVETTHSVLDPDIMQVVITKLTDEECLNNGVDEGSFSVGIINYLGNYDYQVYDLNDNPVAGFAGSGNTGTPLIISNLPGGGYYLRITQTAAPFCEDDSNAITIMAPDAPITATVAQQASVGCSNDQGGILVDPEGGQGPYTIVLTNTTTSQTYTENNVEAFNFTGLSAGNFDITVTDAFSCQYTDTITLIQPDPIVASIAATTLACFGDATASVATTVGPRNVTPTYSYQLNTYDDLVGTNPPQVSAAQTGDTFINLPAGFYSITVTDDVGCSEETAIVEIVSPTEVIAQLIRTSPLTCTTGVEFELSATGGSGTYEYSEDNVIFLPMAGNTITLPQAGVLAAGTYSYYVRDAVNVCEAVLSNEITEDPIDPLALTLDTTAAYINCNGESTAVIYADADGGLGNYQYELYSNSVAPANLIAGPQSLGEFSGLPVGTYWVNVTSGDCTVAPQQVDIVEPTPLTYT